LQLSIAVDFEDARSIRLFVAPYITVNDLLRRLFRMSHARGTQRSISTTLLDVLINVHQCVCVMFVCVCANVYAGSPRDYGIYLQVRETKTPPLLLDNSRILLFTRITPKDKLLFRRTTTAELHDNQVRKAFQGTLDILVSIRCPAYGIESKFRFAPNSSIGNVEQKFLEKVPVITDSPADLCGHLLTMHLGAWTCWQSLQHYIPNPSKFALYPDTHNCPHPLNPTLGLSSYNQKHMVGCAFVALVLLPFTAT
jgi:hypothetical protein